MIRECPSHLMRIGNSQWYAWKLSAVRSAGLSADRLAALSDPGLLDAVSRESAGEPASPGYESAYAAAYARASARLAAEASDELFREAIAWQNPHLLTMCVDKVASLRLPGVSVPGSKARQRLMTTASYLQRYAAKNDTIGFFGPVAWARWIDGDEAINVRRGPDFLSRRTVYFEGWAIQKVMRMLVRDPAVAPWLAPRLAPHNVYLEGRVVPPPGGAIVLTDLEKALLSACDGSRSLRELADGLTSVTRDEIHKAVDELIASEVLVCDLDVPFCAHPDEYARDLARGINEPAARARCLEVLDVLAAGRAAVASACGDPGAVARASAALERTFTAVTGQQGAHQQHKTYAGRRLVYEDTVRDLSVRLGRPVIEALADPLDLVLGSARWLACAVGQAYADRFSAVFDRLTALKRTDSVPLASLYSAASPDLITSFDLVPWLVARTLKEFQRRWLGILRIPPGAARHEIDVAAVRGPAEDAFRCGRPPWSNSVHHSPDILISGSCLDAINRGDFLAVLGELHVSSNTLESRLFVEQADAPGAIARADENDHGGHRVVAIPSKRSQIVNSRTYPPALMSSRNVYWTLHPDMAVNPGGVIPAAALRVVRKGPGLVVRSSTDGGEFDLLEVMGEFLSGVIIDRFCPLPAARHTPRISLGRLVIAREAWEFEVPELSWPGHKEPAERYRRAHLWREEWCMPQRCFYHVTGEPKPAYVDFGSVVSVEIMARAIRRAASPECDVSAAPAAVRITEMLPEISGAWLRDREQRPYTCEIRLVAVDPMRAFQP
jgi:hypothetical protein